MFSRHSLFNIYLFHLAIFQRPRRSLPVSELTAVLAAVRLGWDLCRIGGGGLCGCRLPSKKGLYTHPQPLMLSHSVKATDVSYLTRIFLENLVVHARSTNTRKRNSYAHRSRVWKHRIQIEIRINKSLTSYKVRDVNFLIPVQWNGLI